MKRKTKIMWMAWHPKRKFNPIHWGKTKIAVKNSMPAWYLANGWAIVKVQIVVIQKKKAKR